MLLLLICTIQKKKLKLRGVHWLARSYPAGKGWGPDWNPCQSNSSHFLNHNAKTYHGAWEKGSSREQKLALGIHNTGFKSCLWHKLTHDLSNSLLLSRPSFSLFYTRGRLSPSLTWVQIVWESNEIADMKALGNCAIKPFFQPKICNSGRESTKHQRTCRPWKANFKHPKL